jgi:hypothetical protein
MSIGDESIQPNQDEVHNDILEFTPGQMVNDGSNDYR